MWASQQHIGNGSRPLPGGDSLRDAMLGAALGVSRASLAAQQQEPSRPLWPGTPVRRVNGAPPFGSPSTPSRHSIDTTRLDTLRQEVFGTPSRNAAGPAAATPSRAAPSSFAPTAATPSQPRVQDSTPPYAYTGDLSPIRPPTDGTNVSPTRTMDAVVLRAESNAVALKRPPTVTMKSAACQTTTDAAVQTVHGASISPLRTPSYPGGVCASIDDASVFSAAKSPVAAREEPSPSNPRSESQYVHVYRLSPSPHRNPPPLSPLVERHAAMPGVSYHSRW